MIEKFLPLVAKATQFCDVGVGSGFYSRFLLEHLAKIQGFGFDISQYSLTFTRELIARSGLNARYNTFEMLIENWEGKKFDCFLSVEVLEHLTEPVQYLRSLRSVLTEGAKGVVTAALDAPNRDHIYLYRDLESVEVQLKESGFQILDSQNFPAFQKSRENPTVPQNACFIVRN